MSTYVTIGKIGKAHGLAGELKVSIEERYWEDFLYSDRVFIAVKSMKVPYFISNVRGGSSVILKLEDVDDRDAAIALQSKDLLLRKQDLLSDDERTTPLEEDEELEYAYLEGYTLVDKTLGEIGPIDKVLEMPQQEMAFLRYGGREVLVPLNIHFIREIDEKARYVLMDLPDGLLD